MKAENTTSKNLPIIHTYRPKKVNKTSTIYEYSNTIELRDINPDDNFTKLVKLEVFQGYSKAKNLVYYFRLRDKSNWSKCKLVTGLFRTIKPNLFFGNIKENNYKTLIIFLIDDESNLVIHKYPKGYNPSRKIIDQIIKSF